MIILYLYLGSHLIEITLADIPIEGSPFHCEVVDPKKVTIHGVDEPITLRNIATIIGKFNYFFSTFFKRIIIVSRHEAGIGELLLELIDPYGKPLKLNQIKTSNGDNSFTFLPSKLGAHKLSAKLSGFPISGKLF